MKTNANSSLYEYLDAFDGQTMEEVRRYLGSLTPDQLDSFVDGLAASTPGDRFTEDSVFNYTVDSTLAGGPFPCWHYDCRSKNVRSLATFAALYADKVLIQAPYEAALESDNADPLSELAFAITLTMRLRPVVEAGVVGFSSHYVPVHQACRPILRSRGEEISSLLDHARGQLGKHFSKSAEFTLAITPTGEARVAIQDTGEFGFHGDLDVGMVTVPEVFRDLLEGSGGEPVHLKPRQVVEGGLTSLVEPTLDDAFYALLDSKMIGGSYLSTRPAQIALMESMPAGSMVDTHRDRTRFTTLHQDLPMMEGTRLKDLLRFRESNYESFQVYRDVVNAQLRSVDLSDPLALSSFKQDVIEPELRKMDLALKHSRSMFTSSTGVDATVGTAVVVIGHLVGLPIQDVAAIAALFGVSEGGKRLLSLLRKDTLRTNDLYFLWRASRRKH
jgi:hypothetical protein